MSIKNSISILFVIFLSLTSCTNLVRAPKDTVPQMAKLPIYPYGGHITLIDMEGQTITNGELIGFNADSIFVLSDKVLVGYKVSDVSKARVILFRTNYQEALLLSLLNLPLTLTNGAFGIFTIPLNLIIGGTVILSESKRENYLDFPEKDWTEIKKFSRFPQGLMDTIDRDALSQNSNK